MLDTSRINMETFRAALGGRAARNDLHMLVVEDQKFSRLMLKNFLAKHYGVETAETGEEALAVYVATAPDIVFLDLELPHIDGHQVCELLVKLDPEAFIVMVTVNNHMHDVERARKNGAKGFIVKPYTREKIYDAIDQHLAEQQEKQP